MIALLRRILLALALLAASIGAAPAQQLVPAFCSAGINPPQLSGYVLAYCGPSIGAVYAPGVFRSGGVSAGHVAVWQADGQLVDGGNPSGSGTVTSVNVAGTGGLTISPQPLTGAGVITLNLFTTSLPGPVPASGGGTTNFLRADGTWAAPPGGGGGTPGGSAGQVQYNNSGSFGGFTIGGDCSLVTSTGILTCTKTSGATFSPSATTDTTNASNITAGSLPAGRIAAGTITNAMMANETANTIKGNNTGSPAAPADITPSQALDIVGSTRGSVLYRGSTGWAALTPGTSGQFLQTSGAGADPVWGTATGSGTVVSVAAGACLSGGTITVSGTLGVNCWVIDQPRSWFTSATTGNLFTGYYTGAGGNAAPADYGYQVVASLAADTTLQLRWTLPPFVPGGTCKLRALALANATTGNIKYTVSDAVVAAGSSPSAATLTAETQVTQSWAAGGADKYNENKLTLTGCSAAANGTLVMAIVFNTASWTLAQQLTIMFSVIFE